MSKLQTLTMAILLCAIITLTRVESNCISDAIATSLSSSGFTVFAHALHSHNLSSSSAAAAAPGPATYLTYLAPPDTALLGRSLDGDTLRSHVISGSELNYQSLLSLPPNSTLPTLHHKTTLVVGSDGRRVSFNDVLVAVPNLYIGGSCAVHGVDGPLVPIPMVPELEEDDEPRNRAYGPARVDDYGESRNRASGPAREDDYGESRNRASGPVAAGPSAEPPSRWSIG